MQVQVITHWNEERILQGCRHGRLPAVCYTEDKCLHAVANAN
jgi:hypothetical protein